MEGRGPRRGATLPAALRVCSPAGRGAPLPSGRTGDREGGGRHRPDRGLGDRCPRILPSADFPPAVDISRACGLHFANPGGPRQAATGRGDMPAVCDVQRPMRTSRLHVLIFAIIAITAVPAPGFGQWLRYPTADVP